MSLPITLRGGVQHARSISISARRTAARPHYISRSLAVEPRTPHSHWFGSAAHFAFVLKIVWARICCLVLTAFDSDSSFENPFFVFYRFFFNVEVCVGATISLSSKNGFSKLESNQNRTPIARSLRYSHSTF